MENRKVCLLVLCVVAALVPRVLSRRPHKSQESPRETIKNYEVFTPAITYGDKQETSLDLSITTITYNFTLHLIMNKQLLAPSFTSKHFDSKGNEFVTKGHRNCFYHGEVAGHPSWSVAISTCSGIRGSFGDMATKSSLFHIEPLGDNKNRSLDQPHVLFLEAEYENRTRTCGTTSHNHTVKPEKILRELHHLTEKVKFRRQTSNLIVELVIVNDLSQYQKYGSDLQMTVSRAIDITNGADSLYKTFGIRIVLVQVITWTNGNPISVVPDSGAVLDSFRIYAPAVTITHDVTMLLTAVTLNSYVVGLAYVSGMCSPYSVNLVEDFGSLPAVASTTAHEIGHLFSMQHDTTTCTCAQSTGCIMGAVQGSVVPNQWSSCSVQSINTALTTTTLGSCLTNVPQTIVGPPKCGNGILEANETCDCGSPQECTNPCCNATTCKLAAGAQCSSGSCCSNCRFVSYGTQCRASSGECDVAEVCTGCSSQCPADQTVQDGTSCGSGAAYCYKGSCPTRDSQCKAFYGSSGGDGDASCYTSFNPRGDLHGNCGPTGTSTYVACSSSNVFCGSLQCANTGNQFPTTSIYGSIQLGTHSTATGTCKSFLITPSDGSITNIWLVQNGTKCGTNQICLSSQCLSLTALNTRSCPTGSNGLVCSGNGVCTNGGNCSCKVGFTGSACATVYTSAVCTAPSSSVVMTTITTPKSTANPVVTSSRQVSTPLPISPSASAPGVTSSIRTSKPSSPTSGPIVTSSRASTSVISTRAAMSSSPVQTFTSSTTSMKLTSSPSPASTSSKPLSTPAVSSSKLTSTSATTSVKLTSSTSPASTSSKPLSAPVVLSSKQSSTLTLKLTPTSVAASRSSFINRSSSSIPVLTSVRKSPTPTAVLQG